MGDAADRMSSSRPLFGPWSALGAIGLSTSAFVRPRLSFSKNRREVAGMSRLSFVRSGGIVEPRGDYYSSKQCERRRAAPQSLLIVCGCCGHSWLTAGWRRAKPACVRRRASRCSQSPPGLAPRPDQGLAPSRALQGSGKLLWSRNVVCDARAARKYVTL